LFKIKDEASMFILTTSIQHHTEGTYQIARQKNVQGFERETKCTKMLLCALSMAVHIEKPDQQLIGINDS
jgi:hypothetical protein